MKDQLLRLALAVTLLLLCAWPGASIAQAAIADSVGAWGYDKFGQATVPVTAQSGVTAIAAGVYYTVALKNDGSVVAWGENYWGQVTGTPSTNSIGTTASPVTLGDQVLSGVTAIAAGGYHIVALKNDGSVVAWGWNNWGQVTGTPTTDEPYFGIASPVTLGDQVLSGVTAIAAGGVHTVALKNDGSVVVWGNNDYGQRTIPLAAQSGVTAIAAKGHHTVALKSDGSVVVWGNNQFGQTTVPVAAQNGVTAIAAGSFHNVALKKDGTVVAWGNNVYGQTNVPVGLSGVTAIAAGADHTVVLKNDGSVMAWGAGTVNNPEYYPYHGQSIVPTGLSGATAIAAGFWHTVALVIPTAPNITTQPGDQAVNVWQSASFTVGTAGFPLHYQWRKDGVDLAGATSATYSLTFAQTNQAGSYTVVVSNSTGSVTSAPPALLMVNAVAAPGTVAAWGDYRFAIKGAITITGYTGPPVAVIPSEINGLPVTAVGAYAFFESDVISVTIPNSVTSIQDQGFHSCRSLINITLPNSVTSIGNEAFASCSSLTSITIPNSVTSIGHGAFAACTSLTRVAIPRSVTSIEDYAFLGTLLAEEITVDALNAVYSSVEGVLFNKSQTTLIQYPGAKPGSYTIPNSVTRIGNGAFSNCTNVTGITIPRSVTSIGDYAIAYCYSLTSITIPDGVTSIGEGAFKACTSLTSVRIPNSITSIGIQGFNDCFSLTRVYFEGDGWIESSSFSQSPNLTVYYLPGTSGWGPTFGGHPTAQWVLPYPVILTHTPNFGVQTNDLRFIISWATNVPVVVEASTTLTNLIWAPVSTNRLTDGWSHFSDTEWTNHPSRFYRIRGERSSPL